MVIGIFVGGIFLGFSLGFATMALVSARHDRLQGEEAPEATGQRVRAASPIRWVNRSLPARPQVSGASCLLTPVLTARGHRGAGPMIQEEDRCT